MKKHIVSALSLALCLGLTVGSTVTVFAEDTKTIDSLKIAFSPYADSDTITTATEPLEDLLKETLLTKGYDVENVDMTVGTSYTAVGQALSAGSADIGFISGGNYVLFSDDCDVLLTALRYGINKDSDDRSVLDWNKMNKALPKGNGIVTPVKTDDVKRSLFEYTLILDLKLKRGEYADFIRAFTPLGVDLMESVIEQYCEVNISDYYKGKNSAKQWNQRKLESSEILPLLQGDFSRFNFGPVYSIQLVNLIEAKCSDDLLKQRARELVTVEQNTRNIAAHNIVSVTEKWVKEQTGKSVSEIMWLIKYICSRVKINIREENWNSYDKMNTHIIKLLDEL